MINNSKFRIAIHWSEADQGFVAEAPELPGCAADGETYQAAVAKLEVVIDEWIETARKLQRLIPQPQVQCAAA